MNKTYHLVDDPSRYAPFKKENILSSKHANILFFNCLAQKQSNPQLSKMTTPLPFIEISDYEQTVELKNYLKSLKINDLPKEDFEPENWSTEFVKLLPCVNACFTREDLSNEDFADLLLTIATMILQIPVTSPNLSNAINSFCKLYSDNLEKSLERINVSLFSLDVLFRGLNEQNHARYVLYCMIVDCARKLKAIQQLTTDPDLIERWLHKCNCSQDECRNLWRKLYELHTDADDSEKAFSVLIRLLHTYDNSDAGKARDDAIKCILTAIKDPNVVIYDQLLILEPIQFMEGEPIHDLLQLFVSGDLNSFEVFIKKNAKLIKDYKLSEETLLNKMKVLNFMQMCENISELDYQTVKDALSLKSDDELRDFIINVVRLKCVVCKLDELNKKVLVMSTLPRSFGPEQWQNLLDGLIQWKTRIAYVNESLREMIAPGVAS